VTLSGLIAVIRRLTKFLFVCSDIFAVRHERLTWSCETYQVVGKEILGWEFKEIGLV